MLRFVATIVCLALVAGCEAHRPTAGETQARFAAPLAEPPPPSFNANNDWNGEDDRPLKW